MTKERFIDKKALKREIDEHKAVFTQLYYANNLLCRCDITPEEAESLTTAMRKECSIILEKVKARKSSQCNLI